MSDPRSDLGRVPADDGKTDAPATSASEPTNVPQAPAVVMKPFIVSESKLIREVTYALEREKEHRREESFSPMAGGKIANLGPLQLGGWLVPGEGRTFMRMNKPPTSRQVESGEAQLRDLREYADLAHGRTPAPKATRTTFPIWRRTTTDH